MPKERNSPITISERALEMVMRDVIDSLLEVSLESAYRESCADFTIIEISPETIDRQQQLTATDQQEETEVIPFPQRHRAIG